MTRPSSNSLESLHGSGPGDSRSHTSNANNEQDTAWAIDRPSQLQTSDDKTADSYGQNDRLPDQATANTPSQQPLQVNVVLSPKEDVANETPVIQVPSPVQAAAESILQSNDSYGSSSSSSSSEDSDNSDDNDAANIAETDEDVKQVFDPSPAEVPKTSSVPSQVRESKEAPVPPALGAASIGPVDPAVTNTEAALAATRASIEDLSALVLQAIQVEPLSTAETDDVSAAPPDTEANNSDESIVEAVGALQSLVAGIIEQGNNRIEGNPDVDTGGQTSAGPDEIHRGEPLLNARQQQPRRVVPAGDYHDYTEEGWPARVAMRRSPNVQSWRYSASPTSFPTFDTVYGRCIALRDMAANARDAAAFEKECAEYSTPVLLADEGNYNRCVVDSIETARYGERVLDWDAIHRCLLNANAMTNTRQRSFAESDSSGHDGGGSGSSSVDVRNYQDSDADSDGSQAQGTYLILGANLMGSSDVSAENVELSPADEASSEERADEAEASSSDNEDKSFSSMSAAESPIGSNGFGYPGGQHQLRQQRPDMAAAAAQERQPPGSIIRVEIGTPQSDMVGSHQNMQSNQRDFEPQTAFGGRQQQFISNIPQQYRPMQSNQRDFEPQTAFGVRQQQFISNVPQQYRPQPLRRGNNPAQNTAQQPAFRSAADAAASGPIEGDRSTQEPSTAFLDSLDQSIGQLYCYDRNLQC